jgi:hypothetical protein
MLELNGLAPIEALQDGRTGWNSPSLVHFNHNQPRTHRPPGEKLRTGFCLMLSARRSKGEQVITELFEPQK